MKTKKNFFRVSKAVTLLIVLSAIAAMAATAELLYEASGTASFKLYKDTKSELRSTVIQSQDFELARHYTASEGEKLFLVNIKKTVQRYLDAEGIVGTATWNVRTGDKLQTQLWSRTESATEVNVHPNQPVVVSGLGGCCAEMTGYRLFNIETGRLIMSFNDFAWKEKVTQPFSLEVPNSTLAARYIGAITQDSTRDRDFVEAAPGKKAALLIKYANEMLKQKLQVDMETAPGYGISVMEFSMERDPSVPGSDKIELQGNDTAVLWNIDGASSPSAISGVILKIALDAGLGQKTIKIPVRNDELDLDSAIIPSGIEVHPIVKSGAF
ncbi:hypothetical protein AZI87_11620 [Bdellovibrio bacteriovorus]|uniref:GerMN domain-containing protein n=1 Tax=Bdellovibrio bacteriovorus TaxID=959 RepID=A0A161PBU6_BDEBC|nr:hypothetical protein [Bdellovibrio bacteriovorus]KYG65206.1 hypothetical protein AZI87_11620 [Bdellovibrio bacteriovorus]